MMPIISCDSADCPSLSFNDPDQLVSTISDFREFLVGLAERMLSRPMKARVAASDIVHMTLLAAVRDSSQFRGATEHELRDWLVTILQHSIVDESRRIRSCKKRDFRRERPLDAMQTSAKGSSPLSEVIAKEQIARLLGAIERLDPQDQAIVRARYIEGQSFYDVAKQMGMSHDAVRRRWLKAMEAVGRHVGQEHSLGH